MGSMTAIQQEQIRMAEEILFSEKPKPSFAKLLFAGDFDAERVLPFPEPGQKERDEAEDFLSRFKTWADANMDPAAIDRNSEIPPSVVDGLGRLGLLGMTVPTEHGGQGKSQYAYCKAMESVAARCGGTAVFVNAHHSIGLRAILLFGTDAQRERWLPILTRGTELAAFALTEPEAGSDAANVQTRAVYDPAKNVYRINGKKQWITNGGLAGMLTLMAKTEVETPRGKEDKITAFIVTPDMPGFQVDAVRLDKVSIRGTATAKLSFHDMEVPAENILGVKGQGLKIALTTLDFGRLTFGASCTGVAKECLRRSIEHARNRVQFKRPLATFGLVKKKIATMAALTYAMDATVYLTCGLLDRGEGDFMLETAMLKVFTSDSLWTIVNETMQILGGKSFFTDEPYERMMRDARLNLVGEGANEVLRVFTGLTGMRDVGLELEGISKRPLSGKAFRYGGGLLGKSLSSPVVPIRSPQIAGEAHALGRAVKRLGFAVLKALGAHKQEILEQQMVVDRLTESAMAIYTMTAVLGKLDADLHRVQGDTTRLGNDVAIAKLYCSLALDNINRSLKDLLDPRDREYVAVADAITGARLD